MAEKEQEHLRIRLGARLLKKIDAAREKNGRTRTDEIEARLEQSFARDDVRAERAEVAQATAERMKSIIIDLLINGPAEARKNHGSDPSGMFSPPPSGEKK